MSARGVQRTPEQQAARRRRRVIGWLLAGLLSLPLWALLALVQLNAKDEAPTPWPAALALPPREAQADSLLQQLAKAEPLPAVLLGPCRDDCAARWQTALARLPAERLRAPTFLALCEGAREPQFSEGLAAQVNEDWGLPLLQPLQACHSWLAALALQAGEPGEALVALQHSERFAQAALRDLRSLVGHLQALSLWSRHLHALQQVAVRHPQLVPQLRRLATPDAGALRAQQRSWSAIEAQYQRRIVDVLNQEDRCQQDGDCPWLRFGRQPEAHKRLVAERWLRVLQVLASDASTTTLLPALREASRPASGLWPRLRHRYAMTVEAETAALALPYFERAAELEDASQLAQCALAGGPACATPTSRFDQTSPHFAPPLRWPVISNARE